MRCKCLFRKMIEVCTFKRMVLVLCTLGIVTLIVIYRTSLLDVEAKLEAAAAYQNASTQEPPCWLAETYIIKVECQPCTKFEMSMKSPSCALGFKEMVRCQTHGDQWRSCDRVPWLERKNFWVFEGLTVCIGIMSGMATYVRKKQIDQRTFERIQKQISSGV